MLRYLLVTALAVAGAAPLPAQDARPNREQLQRQIVDRFATNFVQQAALDDSQRTRFQSTITTFFRERAEQERHERQLWRALEGQMRPGVAADVDSVTALITAINAAEVARARQQSEVVAELGEYLTPVQQAQFLLHWQRLQRQIMMVRLRRE